METILEAGGKADQDLLQLVSFQLGEEEFGVDIDGKVVGVVVDAVSEVLRLPADTVEPPPPMVAGVESEYIKGVGKLDNRLLILLDLNKLLTTEERELLNQTRA